MKRKLLLVSACALISFAGNAQYCGGGPSSTGDSNLANADLVGESSSISYVGCPAVTGVEDQTAQVADLTAGSTYTADFTWGTCGGNYTKACSAWIDYDDNGVFDADELIASVSGISSPVSASYDFDVPDDAVVGTRRMRVQVQESGSLPLNPCASFTWGSKTDFSIEILPACEDIEVTVSATEVCEGEEVTLTGEGVGEITWDGGVVNGEPFLPGAPGTYFYTPSSDDDGSCPGETVEIEVIGLPIVVASSGDMNYCLGETVVLSAGGDAHLFVWNDGDPMDLSPPVGTHTYSLTGYYTEGGCLGENTDDVTITVHDLPTVSASSDIDEACIGGSFVFTGSGADTYTWDMGVTDGMPFTPGSIGVATYTVTGTDANGCTGMASVDAEIVEGITITGVTTLETINDDGTIDITVTGGIAPYDFDWSNDEIGEFGDPEDLTDLSPGEYKVVVKGSSVCQATKTFKIDSQVGVEDIAIDNLSIYPNPTSDFVNIRLEGNFDYQLNSINGDVILSGSAVDQKELSLEDLATGVYFVTLSTDAGAVTMKVVKQ